MAAPLPFYQRQSIRMKTIYLTLTISCLLIISFASAQNAANWDFNNELTGTVPAHVSASSASLGSSIVSNSFNAGTEFFGQDGWPAGALDPNAYLQFSVSASTAYYLVLNSVTLTIRHSSLGTAAGSGPGSWSLRSSLDGYTTDISNGNNLTLNYQTFVIPLPAAFQSIASAVTFRLYGYNEVTTTGGSNRFVYDNISIQGQASPGVLAVQSLAVTATPVSGGVGLQWQAQGFAAGTDFVVERSVDGTNFTAIGQQTSSPYEDATLPAVSKLFYRIRAQQPDGSIVWSATAAVTLQEAAGESVIRSVASQGGSLKTFLQLAMAGTYQLSIWSEDGRLLYRQVMQQQAGDVATDISFGTHPHGIYILTLSGSGVRSSREFVY
jgi:hypothetical protein